MDAPLQSIGPGSVPVKYDHLPSTDEEEGRSDNPVKKSAELEKRYLCMLTCGTTTNLFVFFSVAILTNSTLPIDLHSSSWGFVCLSGGITGLFAFQRFKHHFSWEKSQETPAVTATLIFNTAFTVGSICLAILAEYGKL